MLCVTVAARAMKGSLGLLRPAREVRSFGTRRNWAVGDALPQDNSRHGGSPVHPSLCGRGSRCLPALCGGWSRSNVGTPGTDGWSGWFSPPGTTGVSGLRP